MDKSGKSKSSQAADIGSRGGKKGGPARANKLTAQERSNIAKKGGQAKAANKKK
jgi:general stress protein YciG